ncbi:MAG TPA: NAD(P)H-dependent oxidoreductase subunit E [Bryobacteraceae bacterium]|nr:NAD(P)H-dependent oxidoreductase subunit E [Bryobacteraceae bacterium]
MSWKGAVAVIPIVPKDRPVLDDDCGRLLERAMARHQNSGDALIEILHTAQQLYGYLSPPLLKNIARKLRLPPSRVLGVATFYHLFRVSPRQRHSAIVCLGTACYVAGGKDLMETAQRHCDPGKWTIEEGRCVGSCGLAPIAICDGASLSRVTPARLEAGIRACEDKSHDV